MSSYVILFCSFLTGITGVLLSQSEKFQNHTILEIKTGSIVLIVIAIIGLFASINDIQRKNKIEKEKASQETQKLKLIANRAYGAIQPSFIFISSFLSSNDHGHLLEIFQKNIQDEPGETRPTPSELDSIINVFKSVSMFQASNMTSNGKKISWLGNFSYNLKETHYLCDELLKHYGDANHELINTIDELKNRSHTLIFMFEAVATYPGMKDAWKNGIPIDQHMDFIRHYFLRFLKAQRIIREIKENGAI